MINTQPPSHGIVDLLSQTILSKRCSTSRHNLETSLRKTPNKDPGKRELISCENRRIARGWTSYRLFPLAVLDMSGSVSLQSIIIDKDKMLTNQKKLLIISIAILKSRKHKGNHTYQEYLKIPLPNSHIFFDSESSQVECLIASLELSE